MYSKNEIKSFLRRQLREYLATVGNLTADEARELREWVAAGNIPYDNPSLICDESGHSMDFVGALRIDKEWYDEFLNSKYACAADDTHARTPNEDIPF